MPAFTFANMYMLCGNFSIAQKLPEIKKNLSPKFCVVRIVVLREKGTAAPFCCNYSVFCVILFKVMKMDLPKRKPTRLRNYNYSQIGHYFITICTHKRKWLLGEIVGDSVCDTPKITLSKIGIIVEQELLNVETHYDNVKVDKYTIMPNHIHLIIHITERIHPFPTKKHNISNVIGKFKAAVTRRVGNAFMHSEKIWQTSFHDHIIRNEKDYQKIWNYIHTNPVKWQEGCFYNA